MIPTKSNTYPNISCNSDKIKLKPTFYRIYNKMETTTERFCLVPETPEAYIASIWINRSGVD